MKQFCRLSSVFIICCIFLLPSLTRIHDSNAFFNSKNAINNKNESSLELINTHYSSQPPNLPTVHSTNYDEYLVTSEYLETAQDIINEVSATYPFESISSIRHRDLAKVQAIIGLTDYFLATNRYEIIDTTLAIADSLSLEVNDTFIRGVYDDGKSAYPVYPQDSLLLILALHRLSLVLEIDGRVGESLQYSQQSQDILDKLIEVFYNSANTNLTSTLYVNDDGNIVDGDYYPSAISTALFTLASYALSNTTALEYAKDALDSYLIDGRETVTVFEEESAYVVRSTINTGIALYNVTRLQDNAYFLTALLQQSVYQESLNNNAQAEDYMIQASLFSEGITGIFFNYFTGLLHTQYNLVTEILSSTAFTYENSVAISAFIEYYRRHKDYWDFRPSLQPIVDLSFNLYSTLYSPGELHFLPGYTSSGSFITFDSSIILRNPAIVNYQTITFLSKVLPVSTIFRIPFEPKVGVSFTYRLNVSYDETTSIYGSSNISMSINLRSAVYMTFNTSTSNTSLIVSSTSLDGKIKNNQTIIEQTLSSSVGGEQLIEITISYSSYSLIWISHFLFFTQRISIKTDPNEITVTQGQDDFVRFAVICENTQGNPVVDALVDVKVSDDIIFTEITAPGGIANFEIPIQEVFSTDNNPLSMQQSESNSKALNITASKPGFDFSSINKTAILRRNRLQIYFSRDLFVKRGSDLTVTISVEPQIQTHVGNPRGAFFLEGAQLSFNGPDISLPTQITLETSKYDSDIELAINVISDNFQSQWFNQTIIIEELDAFEFVYFYFEKAISSTWIQVLGSLGVLWAILWRKFLLLIGALNKCPYCGETTKKKYSVCRYCGHILDTTSYKELQGTKDTQKEKTKKEENNAFNSDKLDIKTIDIDTEEKEE